MPESDDVAPEVDWARVYRSKYATRLTNSIEWFGMADELMAAAEILQPHVAEWWEGIRPKSKDEVYAPPAHSFHNVQMMLYAYAIENYCKGFLAAGLDLNGFV
ncbi:MAG: hypothetical protein A2W26_06570 [Acidobacteria bacterium RBG_16_64_8]|nr:MAG: hypothetical protein A2W26_06570 [Acidobacteria bacterium RBG_16_64_8]